MRSKRIFLPSRQHAARHLAPIEMDIVAGHDASVSFRQKNTRKGLPYLAVLAITRKTRENITRTDRGHRHGGERPAKLRLGVRSITVLWRSMLPGGTDRTNCLRTRPHRRRGRCGRYFTGSPIRCTSPPDRIPRVPPSASLCGRTICSGRPS